MFALGWKPSNWFSSSSIVLCTSRSPAFSLSNRLVPFKEQVNKSYMNETFKLKMSPCENVTFRLELNQSMGCQFLLNTHFQRQLEIITLMYVMFC